MLHIFLALCVVSFSLAVVLIILSSLAWLRSGVATFRHFSLLFCAVLVLLVSESLKLYEEATPQLVFGDRLPVTCAILSLAGAGGLAAAILLIAFDVVGVPIGPWRMILHVLFTAAAAAAAGAKEIFPRPAFASLSEILMAGVQVYAIIVVLVFFRRITDRRLRSIVQSVLLAAAIMLVGTAAQLVAAGSKGLAFLSGFPFVQLTFFLVVVSLFLFYALRYLFQPEPLAGFEVSEDVVRRFAISPREREIISMIVRGLPNRAIGEKLFISTTTVKNHVYHIYRKTGVTNKIQLINLMNSPK
ncbi:MAG TPA: helix-turn-helix transcriptional regulator [Spirochaetia bacterium]|nr:helix-turn-helix transcriptional regulator [Spirochaetia bacterium]